MEPRLASKERTRTWGTDTRAWNHKASLQQCEMQELLTAEYAEKGRGGRREKH
jgi:hypothetical protein